MARTRQHRHVLRSALDLVNEGMAVFPLHPRDGRPINGVDWPAQATHDPATVRQWWEIAPFNIGIATGGPSSLLVLATRPPTRIGLTHGMQELAELARAAGAAFPGDTRVIAGPFGRHDLYFRIPDGLELDSADGRLGPNIDNLGQGEYAVGRGSVINGGLYKEVNPADPKPLPGWLLTLLQRPSAEGIGSHPSVSAQRISDYVATVVRDQTARVAAAPSKGLRQTLFVASVRLGRLVADQRLPDTAAWSALTDACRNHVSARAIDPAVVQATIRTGFQRADGRRGRAQTPLASKCQQPRRNGP